MLPTFIRVYKLILFLSYVSKSTITNFLQNLKKNRDGLIPQVNLEWSKMEHHVTLQVVSLDLEIQNWLDMTMKLIKKEFVTF